jgi:hypothetical protein
VHLADVLAGFGTQRLAVQAGKRSSSSAWSAARWRPNSEVRSGSASVSPRSATHWARSAGRPERMSIFTAGSE